MPRSYRALVLATVLVAAPVWAADVKLDTDDQKTLYALGLALSRNLDSFNLTPEELAIVSAGMTDGVSGKEPKVKLDDYRQKLQALSQARASQVAEAEKKTGEAFLTKMAGEKGAEKTSSGLIYIETQKGSGDTPKPTDTVKVHYHGTLRDGSVFDSSVDRKTPATFPLNRVIPCWTEGVQKMKVGGKAKLICPASIAYGDRGAPPKIKPGAALSFDVELLEIVKVPTPAAKVEPPKGAEPKSPH
jgi:FKBP-type peptidyl-prolyl cis-trans isomerase